MLGQKSFIVNRHLGFYSDKYGTYIMLSFKKHQPQNVNL